MLYTGQLTDKLTNKQPLIGSVDFDLATLFYRALGQVPHAYSNPQ